MAQAFDETASELEQLRERLRDLERRVAALESQTQKPIVDPVQSATAAPLAASAPAHRAEFRPAGIPFRIGPTLGKAVLGFAGAYLLRAIAESDIAPKTIVLTVAVVYAGFWMVLSVKTRMASAFASVAYALTSAVIFSLLLWESTVRLQLLSPFVCGALLVAFVVLAFALAWREHLQIVPSVAILAAAITALALIITTQALLPFTCALLAVALATELAARLSHVSNLRAVPALAADFGVWLLVDIMASSKGVPVGYHPASSTTVILLCMSLLVIYGGSIGIRTFGLRHQITIFEIIQGTLAVILASVGVMRASRGSAESTLGLFLFVLAAQCYWGALFRFADVAHARTRRVYAAWAATLVTAGSFLLLSAKLQVPFLCLAAMLAVFAYKRTGKLSLGWHASFYLAAAAVLSPLLKYAGNALAGSVEAAPEWGVWFVALAALLSYGMGSQGEEERPRQRLLWVVPVALVVLAGAALAVATIVEFAGRSELHAAPLSVIRTLVICALALLFGFLGARSTRAELGWIAYAAVAFGALKLLFEDLRFGNPTSLVASLLFYGLILILLPRLMRRGRGEA